MLRKSQPNFRQKNGLLIKNVYIIMVVINGYLERDNDKFFKLHMNNSSVFEMEFSSFKHRPLTL